MITKQHQKTRILLVLIALIALAQEVQSAPKAEIWARWLTHNPHSVDTISHKKWDLFLKAYSRADQNHVNRINYAHVNLEDKKGLKAYIEWLSTLPISTYNRDQQRAFWINLYNALTISVILEHYPVDSIMEIKLSSGFFTRGPWEKKIISIEKEKLSLNDIEHRILRPIWLDPRTHYAVNCASLGCPNLSKEAFTAENMEEQLDNAASAFINHPRGAEIKRGKLIVSSIYEWFKEDFGNSDAKVIEHLRRYAKPTLLQNLAQIERIDDDQYDWKLNDGN